MNSRKRKIIAALGAISLISAIALANLAGLIEENRLLRAEISRCEGEVVLTAARQEELMVLQEEMKAGGWHHTSAGRSGELLYRMLQEKGIILSERNESIDGLNQIKFRMGAESVWHSLLPWLSYLSGSFTDQKWSANFDEDEADIVFSYRPKTDGEIWLNKNLLAEFLEKASNIEPGRKSSHIQTGTGKEGKVLPGGADLFTYSSLAEGSSDGFNLLTPLSPAASEPEELPAHIEVRGYITTGGTSYFLLEISGEKKLVDTDSRCENLAVESVEAGYTLSYEGKLYILRREYEDGR